MSEKRNTIRIAIALAVVFTASFVMADARDGLKFWWKAEKKTAVGATMEAREFIHKIAIRRFLRHRRLLESDHFVSIHATNLLLEHIKRKRMERTEPHSRAGKQRLHAFPHLGSGRRRKCKRQDVFGIHPHGNPVLDPFRKDRCLSRARSRKDKQLRSLLMIM